MPPPPLIDLEMVDLASVCFTKEQIYELLPHRHEFMVLDGVCLVDLEQPSIVGYSDVSPDAWWCRGHVPGRPLLPGVLMLEMAAQLSAVLAKLSGKYDGFIGYGGVDQCRFREVVTPPARLYLLSVGVEHRSRRIISSTQGIVDGRLIFEATITGLMIPGMHDG